MTEITCQPELISGSENKSFQTECAMTKISCHPELVSGSSKIFKTEFDMSKPKKHAAFTLAEVLITLAIIGIVAALTIPNLITKYQKKQTISGLKEAYSILSNASKLSEAENGSMLTWVCPDVASADATAEFIKKYYLPYLHSTNLMTNAEFVSAYPKYNVKSLLGDGVGHINYTQAILLSNGMILFFGNVVKNNYFWIYADINGISGPNRIGRDLFVFEGKSYGKEKNPYVSFWSHPICATRACYTATGPEEGTPEAESNYSYYGCSKNNKYGYYAGYYCGALIQYDGWKIAEDYPW